MDFNSLVNKIRQISEAPVEPDYSYLPMPSPGSAQYEILEKLSKLGINPSQFKQILAGKDDVVSNKNYLDDLANQINVSKNDLIDLMDNYASLETDATSGDDRLTPDSEVAPDLTAPDATVARTSNELTPDAILRSKTGQEVLKKALAAEVPPAGVTDSGAPTPTGTQPNGSEVKGPIVTPYGTLSNKVTPATQRIVPRIHKVKSGDSLSKIASQYGVDVEQLAKLNGLGLKGKSSVIYPDQELQIPGQSMTPDQTVATYPGSGLKKPDEISASGGPEGAVARRDGMTFRWWTPERQQYAIDYLMKNANLSKEGAIGLVTRWTFEAGAGPTDMNPDGKAFGIGQWRGPRLKELKKLKDWDTSFDVQLQHAANELNGIERKAARLLRSADSAASAAQGATAYERAENYNPNKHTDVLTQDTEQRYKTVAAGYEGGGEEVRPGGMSEPATSAKEPTTADVPLPRRRPEPPVEEPKPGTPVSEPELNGSEIPRQYQTDVKKILNSAGLSSVEDVKPYLKDDKFIQILTKALNAAQPKNMDKLTSDDVKSIIAVSLQTPYPELFGTETGNASTTDWQTPGPAPAGVKNDLDSLMNLDEHNQDKTDLRIPATGYTYPNYVTVSAPETEPKGPIGRGGKRGKADQRMPATGYTVTPEPVAPLKPVAATGYTYPSDFDQAAYDADVQKLIALNKAELAAAKARELEKAYEYEKTNRPTYGDPLSQLGSPAIKSATLRGKTGAAPGTVVGNVAPTYGDPLKQYSPELEKMIKAGQGVPAISSRALNYPPSPFEKITQNIDFGEPTLTNKNISADDFDKMINQQDLQSALEKKIQDQNLKAFKKADYDSLQNVQPRVKMPWDYVDDFLSNFTGGNQPPADTKPAEPQYTTQDDQSGLYLDSPYKVGESVDVDNIKKNLLEVYKNFKND